MTNADDSPSSGSDDGNDRNGRSDDGEESASSRGDGDHRHSSGLSDRSSEPASTDESEEASGGSLDLPAPTEFDGDEDGPEQSDSAGAEDSSSSNRSDRRIQRKETQRGGYAAAGSDADASPHSDSLDSSREDVERRSGEQTPLESRYENSGTDHEEDLFDVEDDRFVEENAFEDGAFEEARERDRRPGEEFADDESHDYDVGPTRVSEEHAADEVFEQDERGGELGSQGSSASGLESLAREMEEAEEAGDLHDEPALEMDDATIDESAFQDDDYGKTNVSQPDFEFDETESDDSGFAGSEFDGDASGAVSGETEAPGSAPASSPGTSGERYASPPSSRPDNPPPPEETGRGGQGSRSGSAPRYESAGGEAEPGGEFADQETELFDSPFENDPIYPRLTVLDGPSSGQEYLLKNLRNSVGRSTKNGVVVPDETMSRQHLEVVQNPDDSYSIRDLQSVNGTFLNGTRIEEADLFHGDRVEAGQTTFQFVVPGQSPQHDERNRHIVSAESDDEQTAQSREPAQPSAPGGSSRDELTVWLNRIIIGASILMVPLAGVFIYLTLYGPTQPSKAERKKMRAARKAYLDGVEAVKKRNWDGARSDFRRARKFDTDLPKIDAQLERIEMEKKARADLEEARERLEKGETQAAVRRAESIPEESVYYEDARDILRRQHRRERIASLYERASQHFEQEDNQKALATIQRILSTIPNHDKALTLRRKILSTSDADLKEAKERAEQKEKKRREETSRDSSADGSRAARGSGGTDDPDEESGSSWLLDDSSDEETSGSSGGGGVADVNFTKGFALYRHENFEEAISHFEKAADRGSGVVSRRAAKMADSIRSFRTSFRGGKKALRNGDYKSATDKLRRALRNDKEVSSEGYFEDQLDEKIAEAQARHGLRLFREGNYSRAFRKLEDAGHYDESHAQVRKLRGKLNKKATALYIQAKAKRKTSPGKAASLCRTIMAIVPKSNDTYEKAQQLLDDI